jgi:hypothetical protein
MDIGAVIDPLGYMAETAKTADETVLLTSETLAGALRLSGDATIARVATVRLPSGQTKTGRATCAV